MKNILFLILSVALIFPLCKAADAAEGEIISTYEGNHLADELDFCVQQNCSGHFSFINYLVREDGLFAVYYRRTENIDTKTEGIFSRAYIDIFGADGKFLAEISFRSRDELTLNFSSNALDIYLSECMLSVDLSTYEVIKNQTPRYYGKENGLHTKFIQKTQEAAGWVYSCKGTSMNYTTLVREKDDSKEVLLSLSGNAPETDQQVSVIVTKSLLSSGVLLIVYFIWKSKHCKSLKNKD